MTLLQKIKQHFCRHIGTTTITEQHRTEVGMPFLISKTNCDNCKKSLPPKDPHYLHQQAFYEYFDNFKQGKQ
jgi:hypothetical protein